MLFAAVAWLVGCTSDDPGAPGDDIDTYGSLAGLPVLAPEPEFTAGHENTVSWVFTPEESGDGKAGGARQTEFTFSVEAATDPSFAAILATSDWTPETSWTFADLTHDATFYYRVRARDADDNRTDWSAPVHSRQDAVAPVAVVDTMEEEQTSLMLYIPYVVTEDGSGVEVIELWYRRADTGDEAFVLADTLYENPGRFWAEGQGRYEFYLVARDAVGNQEAPPAVAEQAVNVPEPIIITDRQGMAWDITHAVLRYGLGLELWGYGIGTRVFTPVVDPTMICPGEINYPPDDNFSVIIGVESGGDARAYKIGDITDKEVVDDTFPDAHVAVTY